MGTFAAGAVNTTELPEPALACGGVHALAISTGFSPKIGKRVRVALCDWDPGPPSLQRLLLRGHAAIPRCHRILLAAFRSGRAPAECAPRQRGDDRPGQRTRAIGLSLSFRPMPTPALPSAELSSIDDSSCTMLDSNTRLAQPKACPASGNTLAPGRPSPVWSQRSSDSWRGGALLLMFGNSTSALSGI